MAMAKVGACGYQDVGGGHFGYVLSICSKHLVELDLWDKSRESEIKIGIRAVESALADMGLADMLAT